MAKDVAEEALLKVLCFGEDAEGRAHVCILYREGRISDVFIGVGRLELP